MADRLVDTSRPPPLMIWMVAILICVVALASLCFLTRNRPVSNKGVYLLQSCLSEYPSVTAKQKPLVLAIGTSLLIHGTDPIHTFTASLTNMEWVRCEIPVRSWKGLEQSAPLIIEHHPAILVLHEGELSQETPFAQFVEDMRYKIKGRLDAHLFKPKMSDTFRPECLTNSPESKQGYAEIINSDPSIFASAATWIKRIQASGTQVVLVDIPRAPELEHGLGDMVVRRRVALQKLALETGAQYWHFPAPTGQFAYCQDEAHMTQFGRDQFAPQLAYRLQTLLSKKVH